MFRTRSCNRKAKKPTHASEGISIVGYCDRFDKHEANNVRSNNRKDSDANFYHIEQISQESNGNIPRTISVDRSDYCIYRLFPTSKGNAQPGVFLCGSTGKYWWLGLHILYRRSESDFQPPMDSLQPGALEWQGISVPKSYRISMDRCIQNWLGSLSQRKESEITRKLVNFQAGTYQCLGGKSCVSSVEGVVCSSEGKKLNSLLRFQSCSSLHQQWRSKVAYYEPIDSVDMAYFVREQYSSAVFRMVTFQGKPSCRPIEQDGARTRSDRLGDHSGSVSLSREAIECLHRMGSIRISPQLQGKTIHSQEKIDKRRTSRFIFSPMVRTSSELVLCSFQSSRQSTPTLSRIESNNGISSSCLGEKMVVEANRVISGSVHNSEWKRFQSLPRRERGTMQKIMEFKSNVNRLQGEELSKIADTLMSCCVEESTAKNYHSYWHRFMEFLMKSEESPPPSSEMVVRFLTYLFIKTPSGNNCRQAMYAIKHFCKMIGWEDPTCCVRVHTVIRGMCNLATVASKKERDPWRLDFIRSWVRVGRQFVEERAYVLYTCLMIFGIRSMFRGGELGGLLLEDVTIVRFPVVGFSLMARKVKNDKKGRKSCIEATGSDLCPMKWLQRLFETRPKGNFLFTGELPLNTVEISYILSQVAILIEADPGKYSSHSLRIGGATEAAIMGIPEATI